MSQDKTTRVTTSFDQSGATRRDPMADSQVRQILEGGPGAPQIRAGKDYTSFEAGFHVPTLQEEAAAMDAKLAEQGITMTPKDNAAPPPQTVEQAEYAQAVDLYSRADDADLLAINSPEDLQKAMAHTLEGEERPEYERSPRFRALVDASVKRGMLQAAQLDKIEKVHPLSGLTWDESNLASIIQAEVDEANRERTARNYDPSRLNKDLAETEREATRINARLAALQKLRAELHPGS